MNRNHQTKSRSCIQLVRNNCHRKQIDTLKRELENEKAEKLKYRQERDQMNAELEDLSRSLFEVRDQNVSKQN